MIDQNQELIVRKKKDGINHEAFLRVYCGGWSDDTIFAYGSGYTESDAIDDLIEDINIRIYMYHEYLQTIAKGTIRYQNADGSEIETVHSWQRKIPPLYYDDFYDEEEAIYYE